MSYDIVRSITVKDDKVFFTSAASNISPRTFERFEVPGYSKIYQEQGMNALLRSIGENVWNGNYKLQENSTITRHLKEGLNCLYSHPNLVGFLDDGRAGQFMSDLACRRMEAPQSNTLETWIVSELVVLEGLRYDKDTVLDICKSNPRAFGFASGTIYCDRDIAKEYIRQCSDMTLFTFPRYYNNDKELAMLALPQNGCIYRQLSPNLQADKDVIRLAFSQYISDRRFFEHLPDLIPDEVRADKAFMREVVEICPSLHIHRAKDLLNDRETAEIWAKNGRWVLNDLHAMPREYLQDPKIQTILLSRFGDDTLRTKLEEALRDAGVTPSEPKLSLTERITGAESRKGEGKGLIKAQDKETER